MIGRNPALLVAALPYGALESPERPKFTYPQRTRKVALQAALG